MELGYESSAPIGFFDTGVGGISVLKKSLEILPRENYIYFGDSKNAPYGGRPKEEAKDLTFKAVKFLLNQGCKAIVIACNTATSVAIEDLRKEYKNIPIVGVEPALKPAVEMKRQGKILILATILTLTERKFKNLVDNYGKDVAIEPIPCPGLVELIESGILEGREIEEYIERVLINIKDRNFASVVLGCTHYPFVKNTIQKIVGENVPIIDGSEGTSKELKRKLEEKGLLNNQSKKGEVTIYNSSENKFLLDLSHRLLEI